MKPEKGLEEMEDKLYDPRELFADICLLVTEARTPEASKGRVEGPHCPPLTGPNDHDCDRHKEQCRKVSDMLRQQDILWQNNIPMRIDVLLFPDCEHGYREETIVEGAIFSCLDNFELLERWDVHIVKKRSPERMDGFVNGHVHLQAARSYLHFSQLSSWLISTGGILPLRVVYRIYAPGESVGYTFTKLPEVHNFPSADLGDMVMRTTVAHLPRQENLFSLVCRSPSPGLESHLRSRKLTGAEKCLQISPVAEQVYEPRPSTSKCDEDYTVNSSAHKTTYTKHQMEYGKRQQQIIEKPPIGRKLKDDKFDSQSKLKGKHSGPCPISNTPKRKVDQLSPSTHDPLKYSNAGQSSQSTDCQQRDQSFPYNKVNAATMVTKQSEKPHSTLSVVKSVSNDHKTQKLPGQNLPIKNHPYRKPTSLSVSTNFSLAAAKRLPSPKVLVTASMKPEPSVFKKRCLDLDGASESIQENVEEFVNLKQLDKFTAHDIRDLVKPLSPSDLEAYLSSLSNKVPQRIPGISKLEDIPTTKCSFYLSENVFDCEEEEGAGGSEIEIEKVDNSKVQCANQSTTATSLSTGLLKSNDPVKSGKRKEEKHVRVLFRKSLSTSEVEIGHKSLSLFDEVIDIENRDIKSQGKETSDGNQTADANNKEKTSEKVLSQICSEERKAENNLTLTRQPVIKSTNCDSNNIDSECQSILQTKTSLSEETTPSCSKRERTLNELSIPCKIGNVNNVMSTLVQNLESMEIDDRPYMCNSSPTLDSEVEKHLLNSECAGKVTRNIKTPDNHSSTNSSDCDSTSPTRGLSLCKQLLRKEFHQNVTNEILRPGEKTYKNLPSPDDISNFQFIMGRSVSAIFNTNTGLPSRSSPAPIKKQSSNKFDYDCSLTNVRAIKNALSCSKLTLQSENNAECIEDPRIMSTSAPASTNCLLGNFEESVLNGRIEPVGVVDGFHVEIGAGGTFCPKHVTLPVAAYFFQLSDDNAPSPYLGHVNLEPLGKRGYHIPRTGTVQVTLFNPNKTVVKMFVVMYDLSDMPANCQTFLRQRTIYMPADENSSDPTYLRYLIHLRFSSTKSGKIYLHTDIRLIFARDKFEFDPRVANYELRSFTEGPENPKFSPKR